MVASSTMKRIEAAIDAIETRLCMRPTGMMVLRIPEGFNADTVIERHKRLYPEESGMEDVLVIRTYTDDPDDAPDNRFNAAWRQIAIDERKALGPEELQRVRASRRFDSALTWLKKGVGLGGHREAAARAADLVHDLGMPAGDVLALLKQAGIVVDDPSVMAAFDRGWA